MRRLCLAISLSAFAACLLACGGAGQRGQTTRGEASAELQDRRAKLIQRGIEEGLFTKNEREGDSPPRLWVTRKFLALDFDEKYKLVVAVAAWHYKIPREEKFRPGEMLYLISSHDGNQVGVFDGTGLSFD